MFEVKNSNSGRVLEISVGGKPWDFTRSENYITDEVKPEYWPNIKCRCHFPYFKGRRPGSKVRIIDPVGYKRETKESWSAWGK
jgi:hypothetical protein